MGKSSGREALSKKLRFEIFHRDRFTCQYCGRTPPAVLLHVDHIVAVINGGSNESDNLVTSCADCNLGKGRKDLAVVPQSLHDKALEVAEREAQLLGYQEIMEQQRERKEAELWRVAEVIVPGSSRVGMDKGWLRSIKTFIERLGLHPVLEYAEIADAQKIYSDRRRFLYFAKCCWNRIRAIEGEKG